LWPERLPPAVLEHQHSVVAFAKVVGEFRAVAPSNHVGLTSADERLDGFVGGVNGCGEPNGHGY
jgi:hypothetical protein